MMDLQKSLQLRRKVKIQGVVTFQTGWRIGSGQEGQTLSDLGVMLSADGQPLLPGSSLKGNLRSTCETLASVLGLRACLLDAEASGVQCASDVNLYSSSLHAQYQEQLRGNLADRMGWIDEHTCDVCRLFGSPLLAGRIRLSDGRLQEWAEVVQVRDSVVIDRDSQTAVDGLKYDYEVVPPGAKFAVHIDLDNPEDGELALLGAALFDWAAGFSIGGFTSRGLGRAKLEDVKLLGVDFSELRQKRNYLLGVDPQSKLTDWGDWQTYFQEHINRRL